MKTGMKIGFDGSRAFNQQRTGTENYSFQLLRSLAELDQTNSYYVYLRPGCSVEGQWPANFRFITLNFPRLWTQLGLAKQTFVDDLDLLFVPSHTLPLIRRPELKTVLTVHDLGAEYLPSMHQLKQRLYLGLMTNYQLRSASRLIAVSQSTKQDIIQRVGIDSQKISVVYEGFNPQLKTVPNDSLIDTLKYYDIENNRYFLFVGTIQPRKNISRLITAFANYLKSAKGQTKDSPQQLVLAGSRGWLSEEIYQLPEQLGIKSQVKFLGYVPDDKLAALYQGATAFVFPSLFEGFGLPVLEAFACHCPVLTSNSSSLPEVAGEAAVLVDPLSIQSITNGLEQLTDHKFRQQLVVKGAKQLTKFSWKKAAAQTLEILTAVVQ